MSRSLSLSSSLMLKKLRAHFLYLGILSALRKETNKGFVWVALRASDKLSVLMPECVKRILSAVMRSYLLGHFFSPRGQSGISVEKGILSVCIGKSNVWGGEAKERQKYKGKWLIFTVRFQKKQRKPRQNEINLTLESWEVGKESFFWGGGA